MNRVNRVNRDKKKSNNALSAEKKVKILMKELGFFSKKFLGQHFLINDLVIQKIISAIRALNPSLIMEVGPGLGALTNELIQKKLPICVVEQDTFLCQYWRKKNIFVLEGDVLKLPWEAELKLGSVLVGNLPYQVAGRLLLKCCPGPDRLKAMALMFQKEVAQRILSPPFSKDYGVLTVLSQCFWKIDTLLTANVSDFYPRPQVAGRFLIFQKKKHFVKNVSSFFLFVKFCFSQRRKLLLSRLRQINFVPQKRGKGKEPGSSSLVFEESGQKASVKDIFDQMNISSLVRAEELSPEQFVLLFNKIWGENEKKIYTK